MSGSLIYDGDPACPRCGMTSQAEPSRTEPGRWMCHGCAQPFDAKPSFIDGLRPDITIEGVERPGALNATEQLASLGWWRRLAQRAR